MSRAGLLDPESLFTQGQPRFGRFADSVQRIDPALDDQRDAFGHARGLLARHLGYKQFQYFGGMSRDLIFGCALIDLGYLNSVFLYVFDRHSGEKLTHSVRLPGHLGMTLSQSPVEGESRLQSGDLNIVQRYQGTPRSKSLRVRWGDTLSIDADMPETGFEPMSLCTRAGYHGWVYANKTAGLPLTGTLRWGSRLVDLAACGAMGHHDFSCGYMRRETWWNWACLSGLSQPANAPAVTIGLNLSCGVNETTHSENCLWLDGRLVPVTGTAFHFEQRNPLAPWHIVSLDGQVDLRFTALGRHQEKMRLPLVASHFQQIFGVFDGHLRVNETIYPVTSLTGFVEDQFVRW